MEEKINAADYLTAQVRLREPRSAIAPFVYRMLLGGSRMVSPAVRDFQEKFLPIPYSIIGYREFHPFPGERTGRREFFLIGPQGRIYQEKGTQSEITTIAIKPGGTRALTGVPAAGVVNRIVSMERLWGREARELEGRLARERDLERRMDLIEEALIQKVPADPERDLFVVGAAAAIERRKGKGSLETFFAGTGYSRRQVLNRFNESLGFSPKHFAQIVRLRNLFRNLDLKAGLDWAKLAQEHGYSDQAHLIREFRKLMGDTPVRFAKEFRERGMFLPGTDQSVMVYRKKG